MDSDVSNETLMRGVEMTRNLSDVLAVVDDRKVVIVAEDRSSTYYAEEVPIRSGVASGSSLASEVLRSPNAIWSPKREGQRNGEECDSDISLESIDLTSYEYGGSVECLGPESQITICHGHGCEDLPQENQFTQRHMSERVMQGINPTFVECISTEYLCQSAFKFVDKDFTNGTDKALTSLQNDLAPIFNTEGKSAEELTMSSCHEDRDVTTKHCTVFVHNNNEPAAFFDHVGNEFRDASKCGRTSAFDDLLFDIYDRWHSAFRDSFDSDTFTDMTESDVFLGRNEWNPSGTDMDKRHLNITVLKTKDVFELEMMVSDLLHRISQMSSHLVRQLKCRERRLAVLRDKCDIVTAILHASSLKRRIDSKIRFSIEPLPADDGFSQWKDAMKAVARLPLGIPPEFRRKVWLALADNYLNSLCVDWEKTKRLAFNEKSNPDDNKLGLQIVKDLHRTGCSGFNGRDNEEDRAVLKRVLLAYARWNKQVGYCQGFNILAALILDVVERREDSALKVMIFLVDYVLPESYFANNLHALSVDMAVFRDLLHSRLSLLSKHLDRLQNAAFDQTTGASYEPPLTNVFTMQWFLTLFATCLPKATALRVWDSVLLEGSEILLRAAIAIWGSLESRILGIQSADEFYSSMGVLSQEMLDGKIIEADKLMKGIYTMAQFPFPQLTELREKYTYNITPFTAALNAGKHSRKIASEGGPGASSYADDEDFDEDEMLENINCFAGLFLSQHPSPSKTAANAAATDVESSSDVSKASPGAYAATPVDIAIGMPAYSDRVTLDIDMLHKQYKRLKQRQKQAHIILAAASAQQKQSQLSRNLEVPPEGVVAPIESPTAVNHLFVSRQMMNNKNRTVARAPTISASFCNHGDNGFELTSLHSLKRSTKRPEKDSGSAKIRIKPSPHGSLSSFSDISKLSDSVSCVSVDTDGAEGSSGSSSCDSLIPSNNNNGGNRIVNEDLKMMQDSQNKIPSIDLASSCRDEQRRLEGGIEESEKCNFLMELDGVSVPGKGSTLDLCDYDKVSARENDKIHSTFVLKPSSLCASECEREMANVKSEGKEVEQLQDLPGGLCASSSQDMTNEADVTKCMKLSAKEPLPLTSTKKMRKPESNLEKPAEKQTLNYDASSKVFYPFPKQYMNPRKTRSNVRLGLYSEENISRLEGGTVGGGPIKRSADQLHRTAYLQRQYMMEVSKQSKANQS